MRATITSRQRSLLLFLSASGFIAWYSGVGQRLEARDVSGARVASITVLRGRAPMRVSDFIERDPFVGAPTSGAAASDAHTSDDANIAGPNTRNDPNVTVPDIALAAAEADPTSTSAIAGPSMTLTVRATIVGRNSVAYVANGSRMDIVRVGDSLGSRRIVRIDIDGIAFDDGTRLELTGGYVRPSPRATDGNSITLRIEQLRKMLASRPRRNRSNVQAIDERRLVSPEATATDPTPGPLMTVDSSGLAPGVNPTPNSNGPTAFPYPYPYPAAHR